MKIGQHFDLPGVGTDGAATDLGPACMRLRDWMGLVRGLLDGSVRVTKVGDRESVLGR